MKLKNKYTINGYTFPDNFIKFLNDKNIFKKYRNNFNINFGFFKLGLLEIDLINLAFDWSESPEGHKFWYVMHCEWTYKCMTK